MDGLACQQDVNRSPFILVFGFYLCWMMAIALLARSRVKDIAAANPDVDDYTAHYTGGKSYGSLILALTIFSTLFSGQTVLGIPQEGVDLGYFALRHMYTVLPAIAVVLIFVPRLRRMSVARQYDSLGDLVVDRFNNKFLTLIVSFSWIGSMMITVITQMFLVYLFIPMVAGLDSAGNSMLDPQWTIAFVGIIIAFCETLGGFDSVAVTDAAQSVIMLFALIVVPILTHILFGGPGGSTISDCGNSELIICANGPNNSFGIEAMCMPGCQIGLPAFKNGCMEDHFTGGALVTHPATGFSHFYHNASMTPPMPYVPYLPFSGFVLDSTEYSSMQWMQFLGLGLLVFFNFAFNVPITMRIFAAKTDGAIKKAGFMVTLSCYVAILPSIFIGLQIHSVLQQVYQPPPGMAGSSGYGLLMTDFLRRGGFYGFMAVIGSVSAIAAAMSTIDSSLIGIGNCLTNDILKKIVAPSYPKADDPMVLGVINKLVTIVVMGISCVLVIWHCLFNPTADYCPKDIVPLSVTEIVSRISAWGFTFSGLSFMTMFWALFAKTTSPVAMIISFIGSFAIFLGLWNDMLSIEMYGTNMAYDKAPNFVLGNARYKTLYLSAMKMPIFIIPLGCILAFVLSLLIGGNVNPEFLKYSPDVFKKYSGGESSEPCSKEEVLKVMEGTVEPIKSKVGVTSIISALVITILVLPIWEESHNGCNVMSWGMNEAMGVTGLMGCQGPTYVAGIPQFAFIIIVGVCIANVMLLIAMYSWKTVDAEGMNVFGGIISEDASKSNKVGVEPMESDKAAEAAK